MKKFLKVGLISASLLVPIGAVVAIAGAHKTVVKTVTKSASATPTPPASTTSSIPTSATLDGSSLFGCLQQAGFQVTDSGQLATPSVIRQFTSADPNQDDGFTPLGWRANDIQLVSSNGSAVAMLGVFDSNSAAAGEVARTNQANQTREQEGLAPLLPPTAVENVAVLALADQAEIQQAIAGC